MKSKTKDTALNQLSSTSEYSDIDAEVVVPKKPQKTKPNQIKNIIKKAAHKNLVTVAVSKQKINRKKENKSIVVKKSRPDTSSQNKMKKYLQ